VSDVVFKGRLPRWLPDHTLVPALAPMRTIADRTGGEILVETTGDTVHISCVTPEGLACVRCGCAVEARVRRVSRFGRTRDATRIILVSTCDECGAS
jgi:hypothetical protein